MFSARRINNRRRLIAYAQARHREDLASVFVDRPTTASADGVAHAIEMLRHLPVPVPMIVDPVDLWLSARIVAALHAHGIRTLADLTVRIPRLRTVVAHHRRRDRVPEFPAAR